MNEEPRVTTSFWPPRNTEIAGAEQRGVSEALGREAAQREMAKIRAGRAFNLLLRESAHWSRRFAREVTARSLLAREWIAKRLAKSLDFKICGRASAIRRRSKPSTISTTDSRH